jgi:hypothetical protein
MAPLLRSDIMQSYGISGHFKLVKDWSNGSLTPSQFKAVLIWTGYCVQFDTQYNGVVFEYLI